MTDHATQELHELVDRLIAENNGRIAPGGMKIYAVRYAGGGKPPEGRREGLQGINGLVMIGSPSAYGRWWNQTTEIVGPTWTEDPTYT